MKKVLSLLVGFVFVQTQCWALSGGPVYSGNQASVTGIYAGVLTGVTTTGDILGAGGTTTSVGTNSIGLFLITVPKSGFATGTTALFFEGTSFSSTLTGIADPNNKTLVAIADGTVRTTVITGGGFIDPTITITGGGRQPEANGSIKAKLSSGRQGAVTLKGDAIFNVSILSTITVDAVPPATGTTTSTVRVPSGTLAFKLDGFRQADAPTTVAQTGTTVP
ncbi:MAG: hypothetical protein K8R23_14075 [Chthoniobacter sp.]|nr:hypothetical protein [Chthoniobacter sp.]